MNDEEWAKTGGRFDCEVCGSAGHTTGECDGFDEWIKNNNRMSHSEFIKVAKDANALPAQTCRALGPESDEDIAMYAECEGGENGN